MRIPATRALAVGAAAAAWLWGAGPALADAPSAGTDAGAAATTAPARAGTTTATAAGAARPLFLLQDVETIYPPITAVREDEGVNAGGVNFDLTVNYLTDYVFRGVDRSEVGGAEDAPNLQFDGLLKFNLGKLPHPFVGLFVNVYNDDPVSRFQEVRPYAGFDWNLRPLTVTAGWTTYIFPEREDENTSEVFARLTLDDSLLWHTDRPFLTPYVYGAYDYDRYDGLYLEAGVRHDFPIEDWGVVVTAVADVGYSFNDRYFTRARNEDTGFQHYDVGLIGTYNLNTLLNLPRRYGEWRLRGYVYYTDGIENDLRADSQLWGGVGINFQY